jgi:hypothetical protein
MELFFSNIQHVKDRFKNYSCSSFPSTFSYENSDYDDRKQEGVADSIIGDNDTICNISNYRIF